MNCRIIKRSLLWQVIIKLKRKNMHIRLLIQQMFFIKDKFIILPEDKCNIKDLEELGGTASRIQKNCNYAFTEIYAVVYHCRREQYKSYEKNSDDAAYPYKLFFYDCIWEENRIIYPASNCNAICETDLTTGETTIIGSADEKKEWLLFYGIYKWKKYLVLPGREARSAISLFDLETGEWSYIAMDKDKREWLNLRETDVFIYDRYLYAFPSSLVVLK